MNYLVYFLCASAISAVCTYLLNIIFRKHQIYDIPCERSSHEIPTPRGGGLAIVFSFFILILVSGNFLIEFSAVLLIAILGMIDDIKTLPIKVRFLTQLISAILVVYLGMYLNQIYIPFLGIIKLGIFGIPITVIWLVSLTNIYNFMDGIDGLAGGFGFIVSIFLAVFSWIYNDTTVLQISLILAGACLGFTFFNFPPAKIFMGDAGSTFLGFIFALLTIKLANQTNEFIPLIILLGTFIFDTSTTLIRRMLKGEKWFMSHRSHFYQRLLIIGFPHKTVTISEYIITIYLGIMSVQYLFAQDLVKAGIIFTSLCVLFACILYVNYSEKKFKPKKYDN